MLTGDRAKFFGIVMGLTFAALLITQQGSIFCGLMLRTASQITDTTGADLWVMDPNVLQIDDNKPMIENNLYRVRGVDGILWAVPFYKGNGRAKVSNVEGKPKKVIESVILLGLDDSSMVGGPRKILVGQLSDLRKPDAVIVDQTRLPKLFPGLAKSYYEKPDPKKPGYDKKQDIRHFVGKEIEMNDHRAIIVGICEAERTFQSNPVIYTTYSRAKSYIPQERKVLSYVLAKVKGADDPKLTPEQRADLCARAARQVKLQTGLMALSNDDFLWKTIWYYMIYTGIPINFGITAFLGFLVGTAIAGQTFYNFTLENLKQFGALKAMGATNGRIVLMILLQATVVGLLGYGVGVGLAAFFGVMSKGGELAFYTPWQLLPITGGAVVLICILASLLSVRRVMVLEPAVVFRG
jgi:putative ABC transport system permease protein